MRVPRFWEKQTAEGVDAKGGKVTAGGWGWSETSVDEARGRALESARRVLNWLTGGGGVAPEHYGYDQRLPREEIIDEYFDDDGEPHAFVSRNAYGALILNTRDLMFIDIDLPPQKPASPLALLASLFGRKKQTSADPAEIALNEIRATAGRYPQLGFRVYRTFNGFRVMVATERLMPDSDRALELLQTFRTDPLYVRMCKNQQCFRARLTPKAWRCKVAKPPARFPFPSASAESTYRQWERTYSEGTRRFSTCTLAEIIGPDVVDPALAGLVEIHDQLTKSGAADPLA